LFEQAFAANRLSVQHQLRHPFLVENEMDGLLRANRVETPRVVQFVELSALPTGEAFLILE